MPSLSRADTREGCAGQSGSGQVTNSPHQNWFSAIFITHTQNCCLCARPPAAAAELFGRRRTREKPRVHISSVRAIPTRCCCCIHSATHYLQPVAPIWKLLSAQSAYLLFNTSCVSFAIQCVPYSIVFFNKKRNWCVL
jgi:hypothetical protein